VAAQEGDDMEGDAGGEQAEAQSGMRGKATRSMRGDRETGAPVRGWTETRLLFFTPRNIPSRALCAGVKSRARWMHRRGATFSNKRPD
jgi:hypothetical protein